MLDDGDTWSDRKGSDKMFSFGDMSEDSNASSDGMGDWAMGKYRGRDNKKNPKVAPKPPKQMGKARRAKIEKAMKEIAEAKPGKSCLKKATYYNT